MALYINHKKVRSLYLNGQPVGNLRIGRELTRLVEGEDFVTAEWLKGDGFAYINTNHKLVTIEDRFDIKYRIVDDGISGISKEIDLFGYTDKSFPNARNIIFVCFTIGRTYANYCYATNSTGSFLEGLFDGTMQLYADTSNMHLIINGIEQLVVSTNGLTQQQMGDVYLFDINLDSHGNHPFHGDIAYFRITDPTFSTDRVNMTPCRLLRPIPATLDGNGIARNAGDCGMYDAVSGKFFGNVASSGTFTVEPSLIEGVDYQRHKCLVTDGEAYIDTKLKNITDKNITISFSYASNTSAGILFGSEVAIPYNRITIGHYLVNAIYGIWLYDNKPGRQISEDYKNLTVILDATQSKTFVNGINITDYNPPQSELYDNILLFAYYRKQTIDSSAALITSPIGTMIDNFIVQNTMNLIPVRLLRPLPAYLDANGKARHQFECGMLDLKTKKFYGNVAASGAFSVEGMVEGVHYKPCKWMKGDGTAYLYLGEVQNYIEFDVDLQQEVKVDVFIYGYNGQVRYGSNGQTLSVLAPENQIKYYNVPLQGTIRIDFSTHYVYFNGEQFGHTDLGAITDGNDENCFKKAYFFGYEQLPSFRSRYFSLGEVNMDGSNLTPCRLLRDIPASLDANGTPRYRGECGMVDSSTGLFYGNVAGSGSFGTVGLVEGVDYEVHQWLRVYMPVQQVGIHYMKLPLDSVNFSFRRKYVQGNNCPYIQTNGYVYYTDGAKFKIWSDATTFTSNTNLNVGTSDYFQSSESALEFNEESIPIYGYPALTLNFTNASTSDWYPADAEHLTSLVTVDGIERYIPVRLLRGVMPCDDANGMVRNAGDCGMVDLSTCLFYGNVSGAGSFTVADD